MIEPHGGRLIDRTVSDDRFQRLQEDVSFTATIQLNHDEVQDVFNLSTGRFSPLDGFMKRSDFRKVTHDMMLEDGTVWPLPITLDVDADTAAKLIPDEMAQLCAPDGESIGALKIEEVYKYNKSEAVQAIYGTDDDSHPGVKRFYEQNDFFVGGPIEVWETKRHSDYDLLPAESRVLFRRYDWDEVVGFQTRNAPHRAHEYIQKSTLEFVDGLFIQPKLGDKKSGDYRDEVIMETYKTLVDTYYPEASVALSVFPSRMRYAGPREAVFDAIVRKNQGCTHFIIGRDHAGVGDYYDGFDAHRIFSDISDIGIQPVFFNFAFYCESCDGMASEKICPHSDKERVYPSGSGIRDRFKTGQTPSEKVMRPEVANFITETDEPFVE